MCADTNMMTDASVPTPRFTNIAGNPEQLEAPKRIRYSEGSSEVSFEVTLTPKKDQPVQLTKVKLKRPVNVLHYKVTLYNDQNKVVGLARSPTKPVADDVSIPLQEFKFFFCSKLYAIWYLK